MTTGVGVIGATGLQGGELLRLLRDHPEFALRHVSRSADGPAVPIGDVHPHLGDGPWDGLPLGPADVRAAARDCAVVFLATPPEVSAALAPALLAEGVAVVVDLSPAFRLSRPAAHRRWYPRVPRAEPVPAVYGLPELHRAALPGARLIAVPGCLATAAILALLPLHGLLARLGLRLASITVDGKAGSTGAGASGGSAHALRAGTVAPYAPSGHRHAAEITEALTGQGLTTTDGGLRLGMSVFGVDLVRGVSVAVHASVDRPRASRRGIAVAEHYAEFYRAERFVRVREWRRGPVPLPDPKATTGSNHCDVAAFHDLEADRLVLVAALDNLVKGGAGQALQACNARFGLPEDLGLTAAPLYPA
ncbi:N-acetyl-gamma-glutamyl-phosphate reductase [Dactylosporangium salmoneum]|uniref:N-acetyl-gamma-glutamyl-phosphate reductase n=1 Tax=Dactylosporangium salmoneum TaxID=53361 RepID=A0ABP5SW43_9ACTN